MPPELVGTLLLLTFIAGVIVGARFFDFVAEDEEGKM